MRISNLIKKLQYIQENKGDLNVYIGSAEVEKLLEDLNIDIFTKESWNKGHIESSFKFLKFTMYEDIFS